MAYYDALISKWGDLSEMPSPDPSLLAAARTALSTPDAGPAPALVIPGDATPEQSSAIQAVWGQALGSWHDLANARHWAYASIFYEPEVMAKLEALNEMTVPGDRVAVPISSAVAYLREQNAWLSIKTSSNEAALAVIDLYEDSRADSLDFTLPIVGEVMGGLVSAGLLTQSQADGLTAMSVAKIPWWASAKYPVLIAPTDLEAVFAQSGGSVALV